MRKSGRKSRRRMVAIVKEQASLQIMALMGVSWLVIFCYLPMPGLWIAFSDYKLSRGIFEAPWAGFKYFAEFVTDRNILQAIRNTLGISVLNITIGFTAPILFALLINDLPGRKFKRTVQTVSYLPHFVSWVILGGFMITWFSEAGLVNDLLRRTGLTKEPIYLLGEAKYFWGVAVGSGIWKEMGWGAIIYIAAMAGIDPELYEVAVTEGANWFHRVWYITLPCIKPTIAILFIFSVSGMLNSSFDQIYVLKNALNSDTSTVLDIYTYQVGIKQGRFSYSAAVGLLKSVVAFLLLLIANKGSEKLAEASLF